MNMAFHITSLVKGRFLVARGSANTSFFERAEKFMVVLFQELLKG